MKRARLALLAAAAMYAVMWVAPSAQAVGVGACVAGQGGSVNAATGLETTYVGVNVGAVSPTGVHNNEADFQSACCAETGQPPDCFDEVQ